MSDPEPSGSFRPTGWQGVVAATVIGAGVGWLAFVVPEYAGWEMPALSWFGAVTTLVLTIAVGFLAWTTRQRVHVRRDAIAPENAVRLLVMARAALFAGAGLAGGYLAVAGFLFTRLGVDVARGRIVLAAGSAAAGLLLGVAGAALQRACRIPRPPDGDATPPGVPGSPNSPH